MTTAKELEKRLGVTAEQIEAWAEACERGDYPGTPTGDIVMGRPLRFGTELKPVTFKEPEAVIAAIDKRAASLEMSRSDYLRSLVRQDLATA